MKLSEYIKGLREILDEHGDLECYYSADDEGNEYQKVNYDGDVRYLPPDEAEEYRIEHLYGDDELDYLREEYDYDDDDITKLVKVCLVN